MKPMGSIKDQSPGFSIFIPGNPANDTPHRSIAVYYIVMVLSEDLLYFPEGLDIALVKRRPLKRYVKHPVWVF